MRFSHTTPNKRGSCKVVNLYHYFNSGKKDKRPKKQKSAGRKRYVAIQLTEHCQVLTPYQWHEKNKKTFSSEIMS